MEDRGFNNFSAGPMIDFCLLISGIFIAAIVSVLQKDEMMIVTGGELVVTALIRMVAKGRIEFFFRSLVITGIAVPFVLGATSPIFYYSDTWHIVTFLQMAGIGLLPGLVFIGFGMQGLKQIHKSEKQEPKPQIKWIKYLMDVSISLLVFSFTLGNAGLWDIAVGVVILNSLLILFGVFASLYCYMNLSISAMAQIVNVIGVATVVLSIIALIIGSADFEEALPAIIVGIALFMASGFMYSESS